MGSLPGSLTDSNSVGSTTAHSSPQRIFLPSPQCSVKPLLGKCAVMRCALWSSAPRYTQARHMNANALCAEPDGNPTQKAGIDGERARPRHRKLDLRV